MVLIDDSKPFTEEERQAVVSIQSRFRTYQAQNLLDQVMRGDKNAGAYQVYDALLNTKSIPTRVTADSDNTFGMFATVSSLSKANHGNLPRLVANLATTCLSASTAVDTVLSLVSVVFLLFQCAAIYQAPIVAGMLVRAVFETSEGEMQHEQVALWMAIFIAMSVCLFAVHKSMALVLSRRVTTALKERFTALTAAHTKMIPRAEHEALAHCITSPCEVLYVQLPALAGELLVVASATGFVLAHSMAMGLLLVGLHLLALATLLVSDMQKVSFASFKFDADQMEEQLWCSLNDKDKETAAQARRELIVLNEIVATKGSNARLWSTVLECALLMAALVVAVVSLWFGLHEIKADKLASHECLYCIMYSLLAVQQLYSAVVETVPALCAEAGSAFKMTNFLSLTNSVRINKKAPAELSFAVAKVAGKTKTPFAPVVMIVLVAAGAIAAFVKLVQTTPVSCEQVEITCKLMDGQMQRFIVDQEFDLTSGCTMAVTDSHEELLKQCLDTASSDMVRAQQHTCSVEAEKELTAKFSWTTAQGKSAGVTVTNPCSHIDLCANVSCPAIDTCHMEGQCVAGLCTTPLAADGTDCPTGKCSKGVCGSTAFVSPTVLAAASTCSPAGVLAVEEPEDWLASAIADRKEALNNFRRKLAAPRRKLSTEVAAANAESSSNCDPRHGACPGYDQMYCNQPFALNYRETAVYSTHCCSDIGSMSIFFTTTTMQNKVMVKFHKLNGGEFEFQTGGVNYADPVCRTDEDVTMLNQHDFDTIAPMFDENSLVDVDTKKYDAFGYPFAEKVMSVQFVLENLFDAKGCTTPQNRRSLAGRQLATTYSTCMIWRGQRVSSCPSVKAGDKPSAPGAMGAIAGGAFDAASMLFGKFDFSEFGTSAYGSLAAPLNAFAAGAEFKTASAASTADFGAQDYASVTMDFGDFQFLSLGVVVEDRRLEEEEQVLPAAVPASKPFGGFDPLRATQLAKLAAAAPCSASALESGRVELGEAVAPRVVQGKGEARALLTKLADGLVVTVRSALLTEALGDDEELVSLEACAECKVSKAVATEWASLREELLAVLSTGSRSKVTVTGHGISAALATLAAIDLVDAGVPIAELVTFGVPRLGNSAFAAFFEDSAVFTHWRITHGRDPIPHMPATTAGFAHVGREVFFNKASSSYKVCARGEDPSCSLSVVVATGLDDHMTYMGENFAAKYLECLVVPSSATSTKESSLMASAAEKLA